MMEKDHSLADVSWAPLWVTEGPKLFYILVTCHWKSKQMCKERTVLVKLGRERSVCCTLPAYMFGIVVWSWPHMMADGVNTWVHTDKVCGTAGRSVPTFLAL